jgi:DNA-damage-inducible protein J
VCYAFIEQGDVMMSKTATVRARIEPKLKDRAENIFHRLGLSATQAITIFYRQVELRGRLPFDVAIPTTTTKRTLDSTDAGRDLIICEDADDVCPGLH